ncbi:DNA cytosine methyltransferase [Vallitalea guaymasensis]|uniref:DNA cytosine methyltransferase n=1 Tax=Vallitalea guaymasensis TaxID=1185412 RepID=UPI00235471B0|nr:DNA cytosine methyltransferase [Vallitalea guaymasensis]
MKKMQMIDLFAGAGGLSYGFLQTNKCEVKLAVEFDKNAQLTYKANHPNVELMHDINTIDFKALRNRFKNVDLIIGGPPCQGFSNANRQRNYIISPKNQLVKKYVEAVETLDPNIFVMENVKTITSDKHKFIYSKNDESIIKTLGIQLHDENILIGSAPLHPEEFLAFIRENATCFNTNFLLPNDVDSVYKQLAKNSSSQEIFMNYFKKKSSLIRRTLSKWDIDNQVFWHTSYSQMNKSLYLTLNEDVNEIEFEKIKITIQIITDINKTLKKASDITRYNLNYTNLRHENNSIYFSAKSYNIVEFIDKNFTKKGYNVIYGVLNSADFGVPQLRERFIMIGIKEKLLATQLSMPKPTISNDQYITIGDAILDLQKYTPTISLDKYEPIERVNNEHIDSDYLALMADSNMIYNHITTATRETALKRFKALKQGQNFHSLTDDLKTTYTSPEKTQNTIYKRLETDKPSDTVVNVRKSMWIHPNLDRAISIREAARLQSFPDSFVFYGKKDAQYQQIGNAVPPLLGKAIADHLFNIIDTSNKDS